MISISNYVSGNARLLVSTGNFEECGALLIHLALMPTYLDLGYVSEWEEMFRLARSADTDHLYGIKAVDMLFDVATYNLYGTLDEKETRELMRAYERLKTKMRMDSAVVEET